MAHVLDTLPPLAVAVLARLPMEPLGVSVAELAHDEVVTTGRVARALEHIRVALGGLYVVEGEGAAEDGRSCAVYGVPAYQWRMVQEWFRHDRASGNMTDNPGGNHKPIPSLRQVFARIAEIRAERDREWKELEAANRALQHPA